MKGFPNLEKQQAARFMPHSAGRRDLCIGFTIIESNYRRMIVICESEGGGRPRAHPRSGEQK
jgi:hypothetical protein